MDREAYAVLDALGRGARAELAGRDRWIRAFKTIRWVVESDRGPVLTAEGRTARDEMAETLPGRARRRPRASETATS